MTKYTMNIPLSVELKNSIDKYAFEHNLYSTEVVRRAVAKFIGYDLAAEAKAKATNKPERRGRPRKYSSDAERKAANAERMRVKREKENRLLQEYNRQEERERMEKFRESVERKLGPV